MNFRNGDSNSKFAELYSEPTAAAFAASLEPHIREVKQAMSDAAIYWTDHELCQDGDHKLEIQSVLTQQEKENDEMPDKATLITRMAEKYVVEVHRPDEQHKDGFWLSLKETSSIAPETDGTPYFYVHPFREATACHLGFDVLVDNDLASDTDNKFIFAAAAQGRGVQLFNIGDPSSSSDSEVDKFKAMTAKLLQHCAKDDHDEPMLWLYGSLKEYREAAKSHILKPGPAYNAWVDEVKSIIAVDEP